MGYKERLKRTGIVCLLPVISYGILGPLEIYCGNKKDFAFGFTDFIGMFLGVSIAIWALFSLLAALFGEKINEKICTGILCFGVASYIQNMFMNIKLSEVNGGPMDWNSVKNFTYLNSVIWIIMIGLIVVLSVFLKKKWPVILVAVAAFLSAIQMVAVFSLVFSAQVKPDDSDNLRMSGEGQFDVASEHNIIVFVLDTFGNTQLENTLKTHPDLLDGLADFTYYNNADCHYYTTFPSMTHMLTGNEVDFSMNGHEWVNSAWQSDKATDFYDILKKNNYVCNLYSGAGSVSIYGDMNNLYGKFKNVQPTESILDQGQLLKLMGKMSVYKYFPYVAKPYFEVLTHEFRDIVTLKEVEVAIHDNGRFYKDLTEKKLTVNPEYKNALIIQHLFGTHLPYTINEEAEIVEDATIDETVQGLVTICNEYLLQLKELGVYDEAAIIITADHGSWYGNDPQPVLFVKRGGETHDQMEINTAPVSADDFQATIVALLGEDYSKFGTSVFDWSAGETRDRTVYMIVNNKDYPAVSGLLFNRYLEYNYSTDKNELIEKMNIGPDREFEPRPW